MRHLLRLAAAHLMNLGIAWLYWKCFALIESPISPWTAIVLAFSTQLICVALDVFGHPSGRAFEHWTARMRR